MENEVNRREFLGASGMGAICFSSMMQPVVVGATETVSALRPGKTKARVGKLYLGNPHPGWPMVTVDLPAEKQRYEDEFAKLAPALTDIEFIGGEIVSSPEQLQAAVEKFKDIDGILALHLTMGAGSHFDSLLKLKVPIVFFTPLYAGHEWHTIASRHKRGEKIVAFPSGNFADLAVAVRPFRAIHRLNEAKILYVNVNPHDSKYADLIQKKFGVAIKHIDCPTMVKFYETIDSDSANREAEKWTREAEKIVEPSKDDIFKSSKMYLAMKKLMEEEQADVITINCLGLFSRGLPDAYPCLGFSRLSSDGLGGICEADLKSTMTHLIFQSLTGKPGFISDPVVDLSNNTIIHAHCVAPLKMDGVEGESCPYIMRSHLEDGKGASLFVRMKIGRKISMARLIGDNLMLFSTGEIVDTPYVDRGCRTKITTKVKDAQKMLDNWSCGLHRVIFYGDHTSDLQRFCLFKDIRLVREGEESLFDLPGLEWETYIHA